MFTGAEEPSNQLARPSTFFPVLCFLCCVSVSSIANSAASEGDALFGDGDLEEPMNGRNVEERVGECDEVRGSSGGISIAVRDLA